MKGCVRDDRMACLAMTFIDGIIPWPAVGWPGRTRGGKIAHLL